MKRSNIREKIENGESLLTVDEEEEDYLGRVIKGLPAKNYNAKSIDMGIKKAATGSY